MKRKERHHLKENELAHSLKSARDFVQPRSRQMTGILVVVLLIAIAIAGITVIRQRTDSRAEAALADAMVAMNARVIPVTPNPNAAPGELPAAASIGAVGSYATTEAKLTAALPKLQAAADAYPESEPGMQARYHLGSTLAFLGRHKEAIDAFSQVEQRAGTTSLYGRMARLGKADAMMRSGQIDQAIETWKTLAASNDDDIPQDAILMELGRAYAAKGNKQEAQKTLTQLVDQHPDSPYVAEAREELEALKG